MLMEKVKCKGCPVIFKRKVGGRGRKKLFHDVPCRTRYHVRQFRERKRRERSHDEAMRAGS